MDTQIEVPALQVGDRIVSGYPVIALEETNTNDPRVRSYTVIALRSDHPLHKYVVWNAYKCSWNEQEEYMAERGTYCVTLQEAQAEFDRRLGH